ncbi:alpha-D-ribose 1-methylphosphonate 5-triphosphate synthase subunit PhnL [Natronocella acetinitrilica]|uniref:Alpha-D-ribose 1-methylphosphonate 5-triphosphate synthase subunit PhnL n=1 Tax=Natronocella acetinitrilica TaxID=414046 RepID=A0AAE3G9W6_9GAMM|nr:phosphonate C-P lyase system protein PhnL [Natronocella acetinitrilica]MCP1676452.1 alpha-D-ribose 1-methylphosphonate 5-triphosphate synthase subunit PhnL [Natronocella acetinitrilica]
MIDRSTMVEVSDLGKEFVLHMQGGVRIPVLRGVNLRVRAGECVVLGGPSGAGKSTLLRCLYGNYLAQSGHVRIRHAGQLMDLVGAAHRLMLEIRRETIGYVSQFLRVIPRVSTLDLVMEPLLTRGVQEHEAAWRAEALLTQLNIPDTLWQLAPATFSGGEQQRVNVARGLIAEYPILLLDEPTASLDAENRQIVIELIQHACARGAAVIGIFHDAEVRRAVAHRTHELTRAGAAA